jgi:hypothetical protein
VRRLIAARFDLTNLVRPLTLMKVCAAARGAKQRIFAQNGVKAHIICG